MTFAFATDFGAAGVLIALTALVFLLRRMRKRAGAHAEPKSVGGAATHQQRIERRVAQLELKLLEFEREIDARATTRLARLEHLLREAEAAQSRIAELLERSSELGFTSPVAEDETALKLSRYERDLKLAGYDAEQVARLLAHYRAETEPSPRRAA